MSENRLRMFAGPNGSGKSTIKSIIPDRLLGHYLNPDDIEKEVKINGYYDSRDLEPTALIFSIILVKLISGLQRLPRAEILN